MRKEHILLVITVIFSILCSVWFVKLTFDAKKRSAVLDELAEIRADRAREKNTGDIRIGVVYDTTSPKVLEMKTALEMAAADINKSGMLKERKIVLEFRDDKRNIALSRKIAQEFADDPDVSIVIGHPSSTSAIKVQPIYEFFGLLFFSPAASNPMLTHNGAKMFFRNYPSDKAMGNAIARLCSDKKHKRIAVIYPNTVYGKAICNEIESVSDLMDIDVVSRSPFDTRHHNFESILDEWKRITVLDAVIGVFDYPQNGWDFLETAVNKGFKTPLVLTPDMAELFVSELASSYLSDLYIMDTRPDMEHIDSDPLTKSFVERFSKMKGKEPNFLAYNAYEGLTIIAQAIAKAGSSAAPDVAEELHKMGEINGLGGTLEFSENGDVLRKINVDYQSSDQN